MRDRGLSNRGLLGNDSARTYITRAMVAIFVLATGWPALLQAQNDWLTGEARDNAWRQGLNIAWSGTPVAKALEDFAESRKLCLFLDRRVDKGHTVEIQANPGSAFESLDRLLQASDLCGCQIGDVFYVARANDVAHFLYGRVQLERELGELSRRDRARWLKPVAVAWPRLANPNDIARRIASDARVVLADGAALPHDLWRGGGFPDLAAADALALLASGFGLRLTVDDEGQGSFQPFSQSAFDETTAVRVPVPPGSDVTIAELAGAIEEAVSDASTRQVTRAIEVTAPVSEWPRLHRLVQRRVYARSPSTGASSTDEGTRVVSLNTTASIGQILTTAARTLGVELEFDGVERSELQVRIEIKAERVTWPELIEMTLDGTGLQFELDDERLRVFRQ